jgi:hypothetical protein
MRGYIPDADVKDVNYPYAYGAAQALVQVLRHCERDFSRENIMDRSPRLGTCTLRRCSLASA